MKNLEYKKFIIRTFLFLIPFFIMSAVELALPVNYFSHRFWESINVYNRAGRILLPGPFYPNMKMSMVETGDLGVHTPNEVIKNVEWVTNNDGYRTRLSPNEQYDIVLVGDSLAVGSGLDQKETAAEVLSKSIGKDVYGMGGILMTEFLHSDYLTVHSPKTIVLVQMERDLTDVSNFSTKYTYNFISFSHEIAQKIIHTFHLEKLTDVFVLLDRFLKQNMYHYFRANTQYFFEAKPVIKFDNSPMLFFQGDIANKEVSKQDFNLTVSKIVEVDKVLKEKGIQLIFVPVPNKETIYWDSLPSKTKPHFIPDLVKALNEKGVKAVNTQDQFFKATIKENKTLYHTDDTHWNAEGVKETMKLVSPLIKK
ncbi:TPA: hypothetical protein DEP94_02750 [Candidatus Nomurabacteria bacterium]|nr:hypothetical protein [Candidatus Nomurabacteria bacterium]